jgi:dipeptidyl aminopeptidase/acylaminoacyl peptidase
MLRRIWIVSVPSGEHLATIENPGKLGDLAVSPDGQWVAMITAEDPNDTKEGRLQVGSTSGGPLRDLLPNLDGHVRRLAWQDATTVMYIADVHTGTELGEVDLSSGESKIHLRSQPIIQQLSLSADGTVAALLGDSPEHPPEVYVMGHGDAAARRLTDSNPWLAAVRLAQQEVITHEARDGTEVEGILVHPIGETEGGSPLILIVHGGPEAHVRNGWVTSYSRPGQLAAGKGYAVFYPNYRGSTGRGVAFAKSSQGDAAGSEFDDLVDAVDHLVKSGVADRNRVGITGGSYGGYATGWSATRLTEHFRAGVMFVGISNKISKGFTTEIPNEDLMVHTRFDPWTKWQFSLERSPLYYAEQSRTALLIASGTDDPRVHPSQSLQLYRALKLIGKTPVRLVWYPGEEHGNRKAAARDDYMRRLMRWMDHFLLTDSQGLPPWELPHETDSSEDDNGE